MSLLRALNSSSSSRNNTPRWASEIFLGRLQLVAPEAIAMILPEASAGPTIVQGLPKSLVLVGSRVGLILLFVTALLAYRVRQSRRRSGKFG